MTHRPGIRGCAVGATSRVSVRRRCHFTGFGWRGFHRRPGIQVFPSKATRSLGYPSRGYSRGAPVRPLGGGVGSLGTGTAGQEARGGGSLLARGARKGDLARAGEVQPVGRDRPERVRPLALCTNRGVCVQPPSGSVGFRRVEVLNDGRELHIDGERAAGVRPDRAVAHPRCSSLAARGGSRWGSRCEARRQRGERATSPATVRARSRRARSRPSSGSSLTRCSPSTERPGSPARRGSRRARPRATSPSIAITFHHVEGEARGGAPHARPLCAGGCALGDARGVSVEAVCSNTPRILQNARALRVCGGSMDRAREGCPNRTGWGCSNCLTPLPLGGSGRFWGVGGGRGAQTASQPPGATPKPPRFQGFTPSQPHARAHRRPSRSPSTGRARSPPRTERRSSR